MHFENYLVKDGQAVPENPSFKYLSYYPPKDIDKDNWHKFETWKQSHTYATDAKDGCWTVERFEEPVWQFRNVKWEWVDCVRNDPSFSRANGFTTRQFAKFKEEVEKPKESAQLTLDRNKRPNAITYQQLLELPWYWGDEDGKQFTHLYKPGYDNIQGNFNYFGTSKQGMRIISVDADYVGHTYVEILGDGGTRKLFNGHVRSFEELKLINLLVL